MLLNKHFVFIMGCPRSGTTWLQSIVGAHPQVCTTVELTLFSKYLRTWIDIWNLESANIKQGRWNKGLAHLWSQQEFDDFLKGFLELAYKQVVETNPKATHILDKAPENALHVELINEFLPHARFIHIIRDGRDATVSMLAARRQIGFGPDTVEGAVEYWKGFIQEARKAGQYCDRYLEIRYEDLLADTAEVIKSAFDFCSLPFNEEDVLSIVEAHQFEKMKAGAITPDKSIKAPSGFYRKGKVGSWHKELAPLQKYIFHILAGDLLCDLGYADSFWWADKRFQRFTLPLLAILDSMRVFFTGGSLKKRVLRAGAALLGPQLTKRAMVIFQSRNEPTTSGSGPVNRV